MLGSVLLTLAPLLVALFPPGDIPKTIPHKILDSFQFFPDENSPLLANNNDGAKVFEFLQQDAKPVLVKR